MRKLIQYGIITFGVVSIIACSTMDSQAVFNSTEPRNTDNLVTPPGLDSPDTNPNYKMASANSVSYLGANESGMKIVASGDSRWLVINNQNVNNVWPKLLGFLRQLGLTVKYQNQVIGVIQTDWATRSTAVPSGAGVRGIFDWIGWSSMFALNSMYMYRVLAWQDGNNVVIMNTNYQMDEEYEGCKSPGITGTSTIASSDSQRTKWISRPSNPQLELELLVQFMIFNKMPKEVIESQVKAATKAVIINAVYKDGIIIDNDPLDRAWWRVALGLDRAGLGVVDKDRSLGEYYVYPLKSQGENPDPSFIQRWFSKESAGNNSKLQAIYTIKLKAINNNQTSIDLEPYENHKTQDLAKFNKARKQYLTDLAKALE